jgi:hypothetical protein
MTSLSEWLAEFRELHARARAGGLAGAELAAYRSARDELARVLLVGQQITREHGHAARRTMRLAWALQVDMEVEGGVRAATLDLSTGGFSALLGQAPGSDSRVAFSIRLPGAEPVRGVARPVAAIPRPGSYRVSFAFAEVEDDGVERLLRFLVDQVLAQLAAATADAR